MKFTIVVLVCLMCIMLNSVGVMTLFYGRSTPVLNWRCDEDLFLKVM